jgi:CubicO group peptidase (beta-lactamase class C family)
MHNSFVFTLPDTGRIPPSYDWRGNEIPLNFLDQAYGDKNIYSTPRDLLTWDRALATDIIFQKETLEQAYTPYSNERPGIKNYGLGWRMNVYPTGKKMIFHNGWWHGNNAVFIRLLEENATIIVLGNKYSNAIYKARHLVNIFNNYFDAGEEEEGESHKDSTIENAATTGSSS